MIPERTPAIVCSAVWHSLANSMSGHATSPRLRKAEAKATSMAADDDRPASEGTSHV